MATITIDGVDYLSYAAVADADAYLGGSLSEGAVAWRAESDADTKGRALVEASRLIDRQSWAGTKSEEGQLTSWPRSGITDVDEYAVPQAVIDATCELAGAFLAEQTDVLGSGTTENAMRRFKAGSVEIEYFRGAGAAPTRFPLVVQELLGPYLAGGGSFIGGLFASGTDGCSSFSRGFGRGPNASEDELLGCP
jgi:hypothetical protein